VNFVNIISSSSPPFSAAHKPLVDMSLSSFSSLSSYGSEPDLPSLFRLFGSPSRRTKSPIRSTRRGTSQRVVHTSTTLAVDTRPSALSDPRGILVIHRLQLFPVALLPPTCLIDIGLVLPFAMRSVNAIPVSVAATSPLAKHPLQYHHHL